MPTDLDIFRSAKLLVDQYGEGASLHAANRADEMLDKGDLDGQATWLRIYAAVMEMLREQRGGGKAVH
jgi:hypothetical protein